MKTGIQIYDQTCANTDHFIPIPTQCIVPGHQFYRFGVLGDGSCFFHSLAVILDRENYFTSMPDERKQEFIQDFRCFGFRDTTNAISAGEWQSFVIEKPEHKYKIFTEEQLQSNFCTLETWATQPMIEFVSKELEINLLFYNVATGSMFCGVHGKKSQKTGIIAWVERQHFEPICKINNYQTDADGNITNVDCQFVFDSSNEEDEAMLNDLFAYYENTCSTEIPH